MSSIANRELSAFASLEASVEPVAEVDAAHRHFLVVDDDPADQMLCRILLQQVDAERHIHCVPSGAEAVSYISAEKVDCVLLDYHLLDGQADTYIERIKAVSPWVPIIMLSGTGSEAKAALALRLGAADYLVKGRVTAQALQRSITTAIIKAELSRSLDMERRGLISANKELRKQRREIQSFYHTVSHELKTPITAIREFASLVNDGILGEVNEDQKDALDTTISCCDRLTRLVHDLFDAARIETGKLELHRSSVDMHELVEREVMIMQSQARERRISLVYAHDASVPVVDADPSRISQVVCNLISNAIKYTDIEGKVTVSVAYDASLESVKVQVCDNGFGISAEHAEFIFDRLYQCNDNDAREYSSQNGMGIGLYLCHQIVSLHSGEISVESKMGEGSTFVFSLPVAA